MAVDVEAFLAEAVRTPSHDEAGVEAMGALLCETLAAAGHDAHVDEAGNVVATREGPGGTETGPHLVLNTHVDTVPPHVPYDREGNVVRGRGACDAKGPLVALVAAFVGAALPRGRLTLAVTPDEETLQTGAAHLAETLSADGYVVGEPTGLDVCVGARGQCEGTITVEGEGGHAAKVPAARNAVFGLDSVLAALREYDDRDGAGEDDVLGSPKLTPTMLAGGDAPNRVPERVRLTVDRRTVPPETAASFRTDLEAFLRDRLPTELDASVELLRPDTPFPRAFVTDSEEPLVQTLASASGGAIRPFEAATEAGVFAADAPTVVFGPGLLADDHGGVAHSDREYVHLEAVHDATAALIETIESVAAA